MSYLSTRQKLFILTVMLSVVFLTVGCTHNDPWTRGDTARQVLVSASYVIDATQTVDIQHRPDLMEGGLIARHVLGLQPSTSDTWQYFATLTISNYLIARAMPAKWRPYWQYGTVITEIPAIRNNCVEGLGYGC